MNRVAVKKKIIFNPHSFHISFQKIYITYIIGHIINKKIRHIKCENLSLDYMSTYLFYI